MEITTLRLDPVPTAMDISTKALLRIAIPPSRPANDRARLSPATIDTWDALQAIYPTACRVFAAAGSNELIKRLRLSSRALFHFGTWRQWYGFMATSPFGRIADFYPRLFEKPLRPYVHRDMRSVERCRMLLQHYQFMSQHAPKPLVDAILANQPFLLNEHSMTELDEPLAINLTFAKHMQQEGELTLSLGPLESLHSFRQHAWIASLTFTVRQGISGWEAVVGGVQGGHAETGKDDAKLATHVFHGLRPKQLLIHVLRELAACWGISRIYGISNSSHCLTRKRYRGRITIRSSYDELWQEAGGRLTEEGYYELPVMLPRRPLESVPSRKRALYQRRFRLLDVVDAEIRGKLIPKRV
jgi:uncharacterized protein VirK/YbjX